MNHRIGRWVFALGVGLAVAFLAYDWVTNPAPRIERELQESAVAAARSALARHVAESIEIVDPLAPDRKVGKTYVYRAEDGWEVSGYYRRGDGDTWHPFLMTLDASTQMTRLKVQDPALAGEANPMLEVLP